MIWFSYNTSESGDEQINMEETCGQFTGRAAPHLRQHCSQEAHEVASSLQEREFVKWSFFFYKEKF